MELIVKTRKQNFTPINQGKILPRKITMKQKKTVMPNCKLAQEF